MHYPYQPPLRTSGTKKGCERGGRCAGTRFAWGEKINFTPEIGEIRKMWGTWFGRF